MTIDDKTWQDMTRHDKKWQDMIRYDNTWQEMTRYDKSWEDMTACYICFHKKISGWIYFDNLVSVSPPRAIRSVYHLVIGYAGNPLPGDKLPTTLKLKKTSWGWAVPSSAQAVLQIEWQF